MARGSIMPYGGIPLEGISDELWRTLTLRVLCSVIYIPTCHSQLITKHGALCHTEISHWVFITRDSEVIMFSPCVFVCLCVYACHDVCPDDLTMNDCCHTNNILRVHCWGCLVVQVMFHVLMTSLMTSQDHQVGQILKLIYLRQYLSYSVDQKLEMSEMLMAIFLVYSIIGITSGKINCRELKMAAILNFLDIKHSFNLNSDMKNSSQIMPKKKNSWWRRHRWRHRVAAKLALYIPL